MLLVHIDQPCSRARYALEHMFGGMLGWQMRFADTLEEFRSAGGPRVQYGGTPLDGCFHIPASGWLIQQGVPPFRPEVAVHDGMPVLFPSADGHDPIAGTFYLISRYEEYVANEHDAHGRLPSDAHFVIRHGMERLPVVDLWALRLAEEMRRRIPALPEPRRRFTHTVTIDVDNGLRYLGRPLWKQLASAVRDGARLDLSAAAERVSVLLGRSPDPFHIFPRLAEVLGAGHVDRAIAFFLLKGEGRFDHAADADHPLMKAAIQLMAGKAEAGIHPSYHSSERAALVLEEKQHLERIAGRTITCSRQHFLRWKMPDTLRGLERAGLLEDHSLGFSDRPGFRAGTCTPFRWYDLQRERVSDLTLHPFAVMDSALHDRMRLGQEEALQEILGMREAVKAVNGTFISVWHDRFLSGHGGWKGWPGSFHRVTTAP